MPSSHKTHPLITGTILLTAAGLLSRVLGFFYRIFLSRTIGAEASESTDDLPDLRNLFLPLRRVDPDRHLPLYRGGPGPCEADAALWFFFIFRHVSGRRLCDPALLGPSCGTRPHGRGVPTCSPSWPSRFRVPPSMPASAGTITEKKKSPSPLPPSFLNR